MKWTIVEEILNWSFSLFVWFWVIIIDIIGYITFPIFLTSGGIFIIFYFINRIVFEVNKYVAKRNS